MMIRTLVKTGAAAALARSGMGQLFRVLSRMRNSPVIVAYHRVVENFASSAETSIPSMLVSRRTLEQHLDSIGRRFRFVSLDELGAELEGRARCGKPMAAVTFDDGYRDFYDYALPLLRAKGIPAAVFVVTATLGTEDLHAHDKLYLLVSKRFGRDKWPPPHFIKLLQSLKIRLPHFKPRDAFEATRVLLENLPRAELDKVLAKLASETEIPEEVRKPFRSLTWEMLAEIHKAGILIGSHSRTHAQMTRESRQRVLDEAQESRRELEKRLGLPIRHFAYPNGQFDSISVDAVASAGYRFAYTICSHRNHVHPLLTVPRTVLWENACRDSHGSFSSAMLNCHLDRVFDLFVERCRQNHTIVRRLLDAEV
jgi:peptidoglycan/xylan/chitin deacetylase (PgdA/CDA1 family)